MVHVATDTCFLAHKILHQTEGEFVWVISLLVLSAIVLYAFALQSYMHVTHCFALSFRLAEIVLQCHQKHYHAVLNP
jgi:hypothetical protein